ncbi:MAG TPA: hypothetical protein VG815_16345, partial [Chloroflexota bacterium]|nr:hypothetical protein [Chloroflexota bacterium]
RPGLTNLLRAAHVSSRLTRNTFTDGTTYYETKGLTRMAGYGFAIGKGWVVVSPDVTGVLGRLSRPSGGFLSGPGAHEDVPLEHHAHRVEVRARFRIAQDDPVVISVACGEDTCGTFCAC